MSKPEKVQERSKRAQNLIQKLEDTKKNFSAQILEIVKSRNPFSATDSGRNFSNLGALNALLSNPGIMKDAKKGSKKIVEEYKDKDPRFAKVFEQFQGFLDNKKGMKECRDELYDKTLGLDKEEINDYLLLIGEYMKMHIDQFIEFVRIAGEYDAALSDLDVNLWSSQGKGKALKMDSIWKRLEIVHKKLDISLVLRLSVFLTHLFGETETKKTGGIKGDYSRLSEKGLKHILQIILKYSDLEQKFVDEYFAFIQQTT